MNPNNENDVELLDSPSSTTPSVNTNVNPTTAVAPQTTQNPAPVTKVATNSSAVQSNVANSTENAVNKPESVISPLVEKPVITGTTANSPRIDVADTMAKGKSMHTPEVHIPEKPKEVSKNDSTTPPTNPTDSGTTSSENSGGKKPIWLILLFVVMLVVIFVLPYSQELFGDLFKQPVEEEPIVEPTSGNLVCVSENEEDGAVYRYTETYSFANNEVDTLEHSVLIQGDGDLLNERNTQCEQLKQASSSLDGISVSCSLSDGEMEETQIFNLLNFDPEKITPEFTEAGGVYPNGLSGEKYKEVKKTLEMSGYECEVR